MISVNHMKKFFTLVLLPLFLGILTYVSGVQAIEYRFTSEAMPLKIRTLLQMQDVIWGFDFLTKDKIIFSERSGALHIFDRQRKITQKVLGVPIVVAKGQGGLLDVAVHPKSKKLYFTYSKFLNGKATTALASATVKNHRLQDLQVLFEARTNSTSGVHFGSRIAFQGGHLFLGVGDRGVRHEAQSLKSHNGTIIRLALDGSVPSDNPFWKMKNVLPQIWSYGHRNPQGLAFSPVHKTLWESEFGPRGGDEINQIIVGRNYGWPIITYGREYHGPSIGETHRKGMEQPIRYYVPSISPSGMNFYFHDRLSGWKGDLFLANLSSQHLRRIVLNGTNIIREEELLKELKWRIRQVRQSPDGELLVSTDSGIIAVIDRADL